MTLLEAATAYRRRTPVCDATPEMDDAIEEAERRQKECEHQLWVVQDPYDPDSSKEADFCCRCGKDLR